MSLFEVKPYDREVYEKELKDFLPQPQLISASVAGATGLSPGGNGGKGGGYGG